VGRFYWSQTTGARVVRGGHPGQVAAVGRGDRCAGLPRP
jgi:hypothetical protein